MLNSLTREKMYHQFEPNFDESQSPSKINRLSLLDKGTLKSTLKDIKKEKINNNNIYKTMNSINKMYASKKFDGKFCLVQHVKTN